MGLKKLYLLAALLLVACGPQSPESQPPADDAASAQTQAPAETAPQTAEAAPQQSSAAAAPASADQADQSIEVAQANAGSQNLESSRFEEGTHYQRLSPTQPTSTGPDQVEVAEFFMYSCVHCYNFDPYLEEWKTTLPEYVNFIRIPTVWNPVVRLHAQAFYTAQALGTLDEMHTEFFREMHVNGNYMQTEEAIADFFARFGVEQAQFEETFNSFAVHTKLQRADELARRYRVSSTPTMVVNGKYVTNATTTGGYDALLELVDELAASERE